ncbi:right-handed parallel beta-helix repeat-containing protein [Micromonospora gifhornensis]|uniref:right-handed parallel beta-helix repeat-containing protein n=1 Tax=Micromonospora gifhornensis TaxID=84594 RepID=UPI003453B16C
MSNYLANNDDRSTPKRRRKLWVASGVAGLTGVVSIAAVGVAGAGAVGGSNGVKWSTTQQVSRDDAQGEAEHHGKKAEHDGKKRDRDRHDERAREVPCDSDKLIEAITLANNRNGATLKLAEHCTYKLTRHDKWGNGLPKITQPITLKGDKTKIERDATAKPFRILNVGPGGELTLKGLTIKGGQTAPAKKVSAPEPRETWSQFSGSGEATDAVQGGKPLVTALQAAPKAPAAPPAEIDAAAPATAQVDGEQEWQSEGQVETEGDWEPGRFDGAGLLVQPGGRADVHDTEFVDNQSGASGGAVANYGQTLLDESRVVDNTAFLFGGGILNVGVLKIEKSLVKHNQAIIGGAGVSNGLVKFKPYKGKLHHAGIDNGTLYVEKSEIEGNETTGFGGGILDIGGQTSVKHSKVSDNTALIAGGGILAAKKSQLTLAHSAVVKNSTAGVGGGLAVVDWSTATVDDSVIKDNVAGFFGAGLFNDDSKTTLRDTEVTGNRAVGPYATGAGIFNKGGWVYLTKTKVAHNTATNKPGGVFTTNDGVVLDDKSVITDNRPTNCLGSPVIPDGCFG